MQPVQTSFLYRDSNLKSYQTFVIAAVLLVVIWVYFFITENYIDRVCDLSPYVR
jgi:hypothetical protein